jgi:sulfur carrier protein
MPQYRLNNQLFEAATQNLGELLAAREIFPSTGGIAVAVNGFVVPRTRWANTILNNDDTVDIVHAKAGG